MTVRATIAEFNPFHNGHKRLVDKMKEDGAAAVAVMSGNYVQRGGCAVYDKFTRAKVSVRCGLDLVIELPLVYSLASAEYFALGAVECLNALGVVDELWFGSEAGEIGALEEIAEALINESGKFKTALSESLSNGESFAAARQKAVAAVLGDKAEIISEPNNILGVEYIKALKRTESKIIPVTIHRAGAGHDSSEMGESVASAKSLRESLKTGESIESFVPYPTAFEPVFSKRFDQLVSYRLKIADKEELMAVPDCNEEIAIRLKKAAPANTIESIIAAAHSRRYADSRLRRILFNLVLGNTYKYISPHYLRVLAFSEQGAEILRQASEKASLPIVSRGGAVKDDEIFKMECRGTDVYNLVIGRLGGEEFMYYPSVQINGKKEEN